jgi:uncharacterized protein (DUF4415 family)
MPSVVPSWSSTPRPTSEPSASSPPARQCAPSAGKTSEAELLRDDYDFTDSRRGAIVESTKERLAIRLDPEIIEWYRGRLRGGGNDQTLVNEALRGHIERQSGADL